MKHRTRPLSPPAIVMIAVLMAHGSAYAVDCTSPVVISTNTTLSNDYDTTSSGSPCLRITGANVVVDLNGHTISHTGTGAPVAIRCEAAGVTIKDGSATTGSPKADFTGTWGAVVEDCENIQDLYIQTPADWGVLNDTIPIHSLTNTLVDVGTVAFEGDLKRRASTISGNYFRAANIGIWITGMSDTVTGAGKAVIDKNIIRESSYVAIQSDTSLVNVQQNLMYRRDPSVPPDPSDSLCVDLAAGANHSNLVCDCNDGYCEGQDVPFTTPAIW